MFVDGRRERTEYFSAEPPLPLVTDTRATEARPLGIAISRSGATPPFAGEFDELYIFDGKVEDSLIEELALAR